MSRSPWSPSPQRSSLQRLIALSGAGIFEAYASCFSSALGSEFNITETLVKAAPMIFTGLAVAVAFRAKFWNIGGEAS